MKKEATEMPQPSPKEATKTSQPSPKEATETPQPSSSNEGIHDTKKPTTTTALSSDCEPSSGKLLSGEQTVLNDSRDVDVHVLGKVLINSV